MTKEHKNKETLVEMIILLITIVSIVIFILLSMQKEKYDFSLSENNVKLGINDTYNIEIESTNYELGNYLFKSSDETIATVDSSGKITTFKEGTVEIIIKSKKGFNKKTLKLDVNSMVNNIKFSSETYAIVIGKSLKLDLISQNQIDYSKIEWNISDTNIATIDNNGVVYAHKKGEVTLNAKVDNYNAKCKIIVQTEEILPTQVSLNEKDIELSLGNTYTLYAMVSPENSTNKSISWVSSDNNVVEVNNGVLIAKNVGTAAITITSFNGLKDNCKVKVVEIFPESISLSKNAVTINTGDSYDLTATIKQTWNSHSPPLTSTIK